MRLLVEKIGVDRQHPGLGAAVEFLLAAQSAEGDIRGIYGAQYSPNYTAGILELLVKAGYAEDERVDRAFTWLKDIRQDDGGWPDRSKPFSHLVTGVVLRALAAHPPNRRPSDG